MLKKKKGIVKKKCDECGLEVRRIHLYKPTSKFLCWQCYTKKVTMINFNPRHRYYGKTLQQALDKTYYPWEYFNIKKNGTVSLSCGLSLPAILIGHKIKIIDLGEADENKD